MPGAEARDLGSEGAFHVSVAGWAVGAGQCMWGRARQGGVGGEGLAQGNWKLGASLQRKN